MGKVARERRESRGLLNPPAWTPFRRVEPNGPITGFDAMFQNSRYTVMTRPVETPIGTMIHLSIRRNDRHWLRDWRDFQRIKNELVGVEDEAVELYPAESRLVDGANQFHLWCIAGRFPFGFDERDLRGPGDPLPGDVDLANCKQRPIEEGYDADTTPELQAAE